VRILTHFSVRSSRNCRVDFEPAKVIAVMEK
jgi:hypothetical protein